MGEWVWVSGCVGELLVVLMLVVVVAVVVVAVVVGVVVGSRIELTLLSRSIDKQQFETVCGASSKNSRQFVAPAHSKQPEHWLGIPMMK